MRRVEIRLSRQELSDLMAMMRMWLDEHRVEPSAFTSHDVEGGVLVRIEFPRTSEAEAFAARFGGRLTGPAGAAAEELGRGILPSALPRDLVG
jgi:hypothetical protein